MQCPEMICPDCDGSTDRAHQVYDSDETTGQTVVVTIEERCFDCQDRYDEKYRDRS